MNSKNPLTQYSISYTPNPIFNIVLDLEDLYEHKFLNDTNASGLIHFDIMPAPLLMTLIPTISDKCRVIALFDIANGVEGWLEKMSDHFIKYCQRYSHIQFVVFTHYAKGYEFLNNQINNLQVVHYDIMFNRTKAYYTQYPFRALAQNQGEVWYWLGGQNYQIAHNSRLGKDRSRIFLSCNRLYPNRAKRISPPHARARLVDHLEQYQDLGYLGKTFVNSEQSIKSHLDDPRFNGELYFSIETGKLSENVSPPIVGGPKHLGVGGPKHLGYTPPHLNYYENTFISIYAETIEYGTSTIISEKTLDPLIHGHLILPYSNAGFIEVMKSQGYQFPDWIDYSYDCIIDDEVRYQVYVNEIDRLMNQPRSWWIARFDLSLNIRLHNQRIFWTRPYDRFTETLVRTLAKIPVL